jgi:protein disulfide-isomerase A1
MNRIFFKATSVAILTVLLVGITSQNHWGIDEQDDVAVLTDKNFDSFVKQHPVFFVKFYAPWCGHCKNMAPAYSQLAKEMKAAANGIPITKLDATVEKAVAAKFTIGGFPTLKLFKNGQDIDYKGGREKKDISDWIFKKLEAKARRIDTQAEFEDLRSQRLAGLYIFKEGDTQALENFSAFILQFDNIPFAYSHNQAFASEFGSKSPFTFVVIRNFDDGHKFVESSKGFTVAELNENFTKFRFGIVMELDQDSSEKMNNEKKPTLILFTENKQSYLIETLKQVAETYKNDFNFAYGSLSSDTGKRLAEHLGVKENEQIRLLGFKNGKNQKYKTLGNSKESLTELLENYKAGKAMQYMKSDPIPISNEQPVKVVVGASFTELVLKSDKYVLLEAYAPWCGHCKKLEPIYDELARKLLHVDDLIIAKIEATANEHPKLKAEGFPTILFYKKGRKDTPITFKGNRDIDGFISFLEKEMGRKLLEIKGEEL